MGYQHVEIVLSGDLSPRKLENLVNEAALIAAREGKTCLEMSDFEASKDKVLMGVARHSMVLSDKERCTTAWHEAGHALVARMIDGPTDPVHKVTILPRGRALGLTQQIPEEDKHSYKQFGNAVNVDNVHTVIKATFDHYGI